MRYASLTLALTAAVVATACSSAPNAPTAPTLTAASALLGTWSSVSAAPSALGTCSNFQWTVTELSGLTGSGAFSATCYGALQVTGTGTGTLTTSGIDWKVTGSATGSGSASCPIAASGSASLQSDGSILIPYSGTTCFGPISGSQVIKKR